MGLFCLNLLEVAAELAMANPAYADMGLKFTEHLWRSARFAAVAPCASLLPSRMSR
jgi:hypothetical protein